MADDDKTINDDDEGAKDEEIIDEVKDDLKGGDLTLAHLQELEERINERISLLHKDRSKDDEDKAELRGQLEKVNERLQSLIEAQEEKDKKHSDSSTIVVPPDKLDAPTHQNPLPEDREKENETPTKKKRLRYY